jgi:hypothetical protein
MNSNNNNKNDDDDDVDIGDKSYNDSSGGLDFLGNGSMMDIAMRMGDIDKVLDEIHQMDDDHGHGESCNETEHGGTGPTKEYDDDEDKRNVITKHGDSNGPATCADEVHDDEVHDDEDEDDDDFSGLSADALAQMQAELKQADDEQQQQSSTTTSVLGEMVTVVVIKPTQESPLGISMKTSKGITWIVGISDTGLLKDSKLVVGTMILVSVNGVPIKNARHARSLIQASNRTVKLVAQEVVQQK